MATDSRNSILIQGDGLAALSAARILSGKGISVSIRQEPFYERPVLLIPEVTHWLLTDIWGHNEFSFATESVINRKKVYQKDGTKNEFPYVGYVLAQNTLLIKLKKFLQEKYSSIKWLSPDNNEDPSDYEWVINAITKDGSCYQTFGNRCITTYEIERNQGSGIGNTCQMAITENCWIFLFPVNNDSGYLQIMHLKGENFPFEEIQSLIKEKTSSKIAISKQKTPKTFPASPRILKSICRNHEISIGQSLVKYDPIAGDGTGLALRSADWACKIVTSAIKQADIREMLSHYYNSIEGHFQGHLKMCNEHYQTYQESGWRNEVF
jgi:hypothetical protein